MSDIVCYNCEKTGHMKKDCWSEGGGAYKKKGKGKGKKANEKDGNDEYAFSVRKVGTAMKSSGGDGETRFLDSGASRHFEPNRNNFINIRTCEPYEVEVA